VRGAGSVVALTGAGISVPSGIPDFRSPQTGLWRNVDPMEVAHIDAWRRDPERFWSFYGQRFQLLDGKEPNGAHLALTELERRGRLDAIVTQNIDGLHRRAGARRVIEVHGTIDTSSCLACGRRYPLAEVRERIEDDPAYPRCDCCAPLKPDVVLFGELLPAGAMEEATALASRADLLLRGGGAVAIVTAGPTPFDDVAAVRLDGDVVDELEALVAAL
jgi:NAD-dependent deacetylase